MILTVRTYLTSDRSLAVPEGDERAAFLLGIPGTQIPDSIAKKLGLLKDEPVPSEPPPVPEVTHRETGVTFKRRGRSKSSGE